MGTTTITETYTTVDVENVVRRFKADLKMIADSTGAMSDGDLAKYVHDVELLAKKGYLAWIDVTLLSGGFERNAVRYTVDTDAGSLDTSRPGGVMWPKVAQPEIRVILSYTSAYDDDARAALAARLDFTWSPTSASTDHASLNGSGGRNYTSNAFGMTRTDFSK